MQTAGVLRHATALGALLSSAQGALGTSLPATAAAAGAASPWHAGADEAPSTSYAQLITRRTATKKAGGNAHQAVGSHPKHLGAKMVEGELAFPGMIMMRQRGTKFHPGLNAGMGKDHTIFATAPGFVRYERTLTPYGKERRMISVHPVNGDWSAGYKRVAAELVARRAQLKRAKLDNTPLEPALHFPLNVEGGMLSWLGRRPRIFTTAGESPAPAAGKQRRPSQAAAKGAPS